MVEHDVAEDDDADFAGGDEDLPDAGEAGKGRV
jgi:hypothetical protein